MSSTSMYFSALLHWLWVLLYGIRKIMRHITCGTFIIVSILPTSVSSPSFFNIFLKNLFITFFGVKDKMERWGSWECNVLLAYHLNKLKKHGISHLYIERRASAGCVLICLEADDGETQRFLKTTLVLVLKKTVWKWFIRWPIVLCVSFCWRMRAGIDS